MSQRTNIISWFEQLSVEESKALLSVLSPAEKSKLQSILEPEGASTASEEAIDRNKLLGAPDLFLRLHHSEDVSAYPKQLILSAQIELDHYLRESTQELPQFASDDEGLSILFKLPRLLKNVWHKSLKTFN